MRISRVGRCSKGFTLLELIVAIFIISLVVSLSIPSLTLIGEGRVVSDAKRIASILRYLNDSAVATKENLPLKVGLGEKIVSYAGPDGEKSERFDTISFIELQSKGKLTEGEVTVFFGPSGSSESFQIHLHNDKQDATVVLNALSGRVKIIQDEKP
ncbi:MAG TPA: prepilin-type N-terminal cleavage/methylation domain-containing protein [Thermodesulfovibrionales bacterium]|nr:prepilin-type N-terminal cleavage/methylation domain-containing protein [Thermodesulfovibrionales bacterium]